MRLECPNCKTSAIVEIETINQDYDYIKGQGKIFSEFQCDQCEEYFKVQYKIEIKEVKYR